MYVNFSIFIVMHRSDWSKYNKTTGENILIERFRFTLSLKFVSAKIEKLFTNYVFCVFLEILVLQKMSDTRFLYLMHDMVYFIIPVSHCFLMCVVFITMWKYDLACTGSYFCVILYNVPTKFCFILFYKNITLKHQIS